MLHLQCVCLSLAGLPTSLHDPRLPGAKLLAEWKQKVPAKGVLNEEVDLRAVNGLRRLVDRLRDKKPRDKSLVTQFNVMEAYFDVIQVCVKCSHSKVRQVEEADLAQYLMVIVKEGIELPEALREALLMRHASWQLDHGRIEAFAEAMMPVGEVPEFDPLKPRLAHVSSSLQKKANIYQATVFDLTVIPLLAEGPTHKQTVVEICRCCLEALQTIDVVEVDSNFGHTVLKNWFQAGLC